MASLLAAHLFLCWGGTYFFGVRRVRAPGQPRADSFGLCAARKPGRSESFCLAAVSPGDQKYKQRPLAVVEAREELHTQRRADGDELPDADGAAALCGALACRAVEDAIARSTAFRVGGRATHLVAFTREAFDLDEDAEDPKRQKKTRAPALDRLGAALRDAGAAALAPAASLAPTALGFDGIHEAEVVAASEAASAASCEVRARVYRPRVRRRASTGEKRKSAENLRVVIFADKEDVAIVKCKTNISKYGLPN